MMNRRYFFVLCSLFVLNVYSAPYKWSDLQILSSENNYQEYLDHALDISPSSRDAAWKTVTESMGIKYLNRLIEQNKIPEDADGRIERISEWPLFRSNEFFIKARDKYFLKKLTVCIELTPAKCKAEGIKILNNYEHEITFPVDFLKLTKNIILESDKRLAIARPILEDKLSEFYCDVSPLKKIILTQISKNKEIGFKIHKDCLKKLRSEIESLALSGSTLAKRLLKSNSISTSSFNQLSNIVSFLNNPDLSQEKIETAISSLEKLSKSANKRSALLEKIRNIDPLPGRIFATKNKVSIGKLKLVERNFPEMIDLYARTCLSYLKGTKQFKFGNPTPECHSFFMMAEYIITLPKSYLNDYQKATKFMRIQKKASQ